MKANLGVLYALLKEAEAEQDYDELVKYIREHFPKESEIYKSTVRYEAFTLLDSIGDYGDEQWNAIERMVACVEVVLG